MSSNDAEILRRYREGFRRRADDIHLNNAGVGPMCTPAVDAIAAIASVMQRGLRDFQTQLDVVEDARAAVGRLVSAKASDVTMVNTCATAISQMALGLPFRKGAEIVRWDQEYPSNAYPWHVAAQRCDGRVVVVESEPDFSVRTEKLLDVITANTQCVAISWVQFSTGATTDLAAVSARCREVGAWLVVDAIQGLGVLEFDMAAMGVDAVCGGTHKWLAGPIGHGFLVVGDALRAQLEPIFFGAMSYGSPDDPVDLSRSLRTDVRRFEPGNPAVLGSAGCLAAIDHTLEAGVGRLGDVARRYADEVATFVEERGARVLSARHQPGLSPTTTFVPRDIPAAEHALKNAGVSFGLRGGGIRLSPHGHNVDEDIQRTLDALAPVLG